MAAACIREAAGEYGPSRLARYDAWVEERMGPRGRPGVFAQAPDWGVRLASRALFGSAWLTRRVLIEDGFLHTRRRPAEWQRVAM